MAAYSFDAGGGTTVADASGSGNNGTAANTTWVAGKYGNALNFNGSSSRVTVPDASSLDLTSAMTLEAWVYKTASNSGWRDLVYKGDDNYYLSGSSQPGNRPAGGGRIGGSYGEVFGTSSLPTNAWTHMAVTYDGSTERLYLNGAQVASLAKTGSILTSTNPLTLGSDPIYGQYWQGRIDDVRVYNIALSPAQIQTDMTTPVGGSTGDTQAPSAPGTLSASAPATPLSVNLSWGAATDNVGVTGYLVERCQGAGCTNFAQIAAPAGTGTTYTDSSVSAGTSYTYRIRATDAAGNLGTYSNTATATTPTPSDTQPPSAPGTLSASAIGAGRVDLSWGAATDNVGVTGYRIERCQGTGCSNFAQIAAPAGTNTIYSDTTVAAGTSYSYRVRATDAGANLGPYSNTASATTPTSSDTQPPSAPGTLSATAISAGRVDLSWGAATDNVAVTGYQIERCQGTGCSNFAQIAAPAGTGTSYSDTTVSASLTYSYRVRATDAGANLGPYSNVASATTPAGSAPAPVAAYSFDEGSGTTVADASGNGNAGTTSNATWVSGRFGSALSFNGTSSRVTVPDSNSLHLTTAMTLEAWVQSTGTNTGWRDVIYKGNDNYYLSGSSYPNNVPAGGSIISGSYAELFGTSPLAANTWTNLAMTYDGSNVRLYVNGVQVASVAHTGNIATSTNPLTFGSDSFYGQYFQGLIDNVRIYNVALTAAQIQSDMTSPVGTATGDTQPPAVSITSPTAGASVQDLVTVNANATDDVGVQGVQFYVDGSAAGPEDLTAPYTFKWDVNLLGNGSHALTARARDGAGNTTMSAPVAVTVANPGVFQLETLSTAFTIPTAFAFLPDGRMLVAEMGGNIRIMPPPYTQPDVTPLLTITNLAPLDSAGDVNGIMNVAVDPNFTTNHYFYVDYTAGSPYRTRLSRFTANAAVNGTVSGSELILYQDPASAGADHHGGAIMFGGDGKLYFTTGDEVNTPGDAQSLTSPRGKVHRINMDGTIPLDNPFADGNGPNDDTVWAYGLRNPYRGSYDAQTGQMYVGDVGGNVYSTATEHLDVVQRGANYAWPNCESSCASPPYTNGIYNYAHNGRDACITAGFVYRGTQFPASYDGSFFVADYAQNWIKRLTLDPTGTTVTGVFPFEPPDGSPDGPYGAITDLKEGPDGALYYLDIGFDTQTPQVATPSLRRIRYVRSNLPPTAQASADQTQGAAPLTVNFSSAGSADPEGQPLSYSWTFGDGATSTAANPSHTYTSSGRYTVRLTVSDGTNSTISDPLTITAGTPPVPTIVTPADGSTFRGGDVISYSGTATDAQDGTLPQSAYTWEIDMLHAGHIHPGLPQSGSSSGTFTIPTSGHDFSGNVRFRISLTVTDSSGISTTTSVTIWPQKVNLTFNTAPQGLTINVNGLPATTPFVHDELIGFNDVVQAPNQTVGSTNYTFGSWSDGGAQQHTIVAPATDQSYTATFIGPPVVPAFVQVAASTPQSPQTLVSTPFGQPQTAGNLNAVVVGWANTTSSVASVTDSAGNVYQLAAPTINGTGSSQAIYYAPNVAAGTNTVNVTMTAPTSFMDVRIAEYSGLDRIAPLDVSASAKGNAALADSGTVTTTSARDLLVGAGTTSDLFTAAGSGYTKRIITTPDGDILEDMFVTSTGAYRATASANPNNWVMQMVAFRAAGQ